MAESQIKPSRAERGNVMPKRDIASMSTEQFREFSGAVIRALPDNLIPRVAQGWITNPDSLRRALRQTLAPTWNGLPVVTHEGCGADHSRDVAVCGGTDCGNHESNMNWWDHCHECGGEFIEFVRIRPMSAGSRR